MRLPVTATVPEATEQLPSNISDALKVGQDALADAAETLKCSSFRRVTVRRYGLAQRFTSDATPALLVRNVASAPNLSVQPPITPHFFGAATPVPPAATHKVNV